MSFGKGCVILQFLDNALTLLHRRLHTSSRLTRSNCPPSRLVGVRDRMATAKATDGESRRQVLKDVYAADDDDSMMHILTTHSFAKKDEATPSVTSSGKHSQFKVVRNKHNSILSTNSHPAGWVDRTTEREDDALKGKDWHSEVCVHRFLLAC